MSGVLFLVSGKEMALLTEGCFFVQHAPRLGSGQAARDMNHALTADS